MRGPTLSLSLILTTLVAVTALPQPVSADDTAALAKGLSESMRQHPVVKGRFEQWRKLTGIPRPIHSRGRFIYWRDHGLYWETREPITQATTFTPDTTLHWQTSNDVRPSGRSTDTSSSPVQKQITRILLAVFGGDIQSLDTLFDSHWSAGADPTKKQWTVDLTPTSAMVERVVKKITLSGAAYVQRLSLAASNGDSTQIHFSDIRAFPHPTADDCQYFDPDSSTCPGDNASPPAPGRSQP